MKSDRVNILHYIFKFSVPSETFVYDLIQNLNNDYRNIVLAHERVLAEERKYEPLKIIPEKVPTFKRMVINLLNLLKKEKKSGAGSSSGLKKIILNKIPLFKKIFFTIFKNSYVIKNSKVASLWVKEIKPRLIHAHFGPNGIKIYRLLKEFDLKIPLIVSVHGYDINSLPNQDTSYLPLLQQMARDPLVTIVSPSNFLKNKAMSLEPKSNIKIIPNSYNKILDDYQVTKHSNSKMNIQELRLLHVGRFESVKGQEYLFRGFAEIIKEYPGTTLTIIGYGLLEGYLKELATQLKINENVKWIGQVSHRRVLEEMARHDLYLQPSIVTVDGQEENLSVSTIEAQKSGLPVIATKIGGFQEIIVHEKTGLLIKEKNFNEIYLAVKTYIENPALISNHSLNAIQLATEKFSPKVIADQWKSLYDDIIHQRSI